MSSSSSVVSIVIVKNSPFLLKTSVSSSSVTVFQSLSAISFSYQLNIVSLLSSVMYVFIYPSRGRTSESMSSFISFNGISSLSGYFSVSFIGEMHPAVKPITKEMIIRNIIFCFKLSQFSFRRFMY